MNYGIYSAQYKLGGLIGNQNHAKQSLTSLMADQTPVWAAISTNQSVTNLYSGGSGQECESFLMVPPIKLYSLGAICRDQSVINVYYGGSGHEC